jgi:nicotinamidase-related amidase
VAVDLTELARADHTALLIFEMQRGIVGDLHLMPALAAVVREAGLVTEIGALTAAGRPAGVRVVHCTAQWRADRRGTMLNTPLVAGIAGRHPEHILVGSKRAEIVPALRPQDGDLVSTRHSGLSAFAGTELDTTLRALGVTTVVLCGAGLALGLLATAFEAVNRGYSVVVPHEAVADIDPEFGQTVWERTFRLIAARTTVAELVAIWRADADPA